MHERKRFRSRNKMLFQPKRSVNESSGGSTLLMTSLDLPRPSQLLMIGVSKWAGTVVKASAAVRSMEQLLGCIR